MRNLFMTTILGTALLACGSVGAKTVECEGSTLITVGDRIGAQTPFHAIFDVQDKRVTMIEGDSARFADSYEWNEELQRPGRLGFTTGDISGGGNIFFYKSSGRFEILKLAVVSSGLKREETSGQCKPFTPKNVF